MPGGSEEGSLVHAATAPPQRATVAATGASLPSTDFQRLPVALLLVINGCLVVIALAALAGIRVLRA
jgi:hypothetical protein